jgi:hypothetical protein
MANATWPGTLPVYVQEGGYSESLQDQTIESQMDAGPAKIRRRFTKSLRKFEITMQMTAAQLTTFETFWNDTLKGGSLPFDWLHPRTRVAATLRFRLPAPKIQTVGSGAMNVVQFNLEII